MWFGLVDAIFFFLGVLCSGVGWGLGGYGVFFLGLWRSGWLGFEANDYVF